jgi:hypothetical protein
LTIHCYAAASAVRLRPIAAEPDIHDGAIDKGQARRQDGGCENKLRTGGRLRRLYRSRSGSIAKRVKYSGHVHLPCPRRDHAQQRPGGQFHRLGKLPNTENRDQVN